MKIHLRFYPAIVIVVYVIFLLIGILLGFGPERGGWHGKGALVQIAFLPLEDLA